MKRLLSTLMSAAMMLTLLTAGAQTALADEPTQTGKVFAGYYTDDTYETPVRDITGLTEGTDYVAKFVSDKVLQAKYQLTYLANEDQDSTRLRVVTTVDSTRYKRVGFFVSVNGGAEKTFESTKVAKRIVGTTDLGDLEYVPTDFSPESQYFCAFNFTVKKANYGATLTFTPFWETFDGTVVRGELHEDGETYGRDIVIGESPAFNNKLIGTAAELTAFAAESQTRNFANWTVKLTADIDLNPGWTAGASAPAQTWTSIGSQAMPFAGTFDGQGKTISGVFLNTATARQGLFGETASTAVLRDFSLTNSYFTTNTVRLGSIAGTFAGRAERIYSDALVNATGSANRIGGLFGVAAGAVVSECWYDGTVSAPGKTYVGGLIGSAQDAVVKLEHSLFTGAVTSTNQVGGLIGYVATTTTIDDCAGIGAVTSVKATQGGTLVGEKAGAASLTISNTAYGNNRDSTAYARIGYSGTADSESNLTALANQAAITALAGIGGIKSLGACLNFADFWTIRDSGSPTPVCFGSDRTFTAGSAADLADVAAASQRFDFTGWTILLGTDVDMNPGFTAGADGMTDGADGTPAAWTPIGSQSKPFAGTFDGQGNTISGVYLSTTTARQGLFGETASTAVLRDFSLTNSYFTTNTVRLGSIAGSFKGRAERIHSDAFVTATGGTNGTGGMFGLFDGDAVVSECWYDGTINGQMHVGGLIGKVLNAGTVTVEHSLFSGTVTGISQVGGLIGVTQSASGGVTIYDSASLGTVTKTGSSTQNGILVGYNTTTLTARHSTAANSTAGNVTSGVANGTGSSYTYPNSGILSTKVSELTGFNGKTKLSAYLLFDEYWSIRENDVPVPVYFSEGGGSNVYVISTADALLAFAAESQTNNFAGWTIKLGADIDLNPGWDASAKVAAAQAWTPIGSQSKPFAGTFDGQGHTISGVYMEISAAINGLFRKTAETAVLKNFRLENSFLNVTAGNRVGSIAGDGYGAIYNVYSNAIIDGRGWTGGLVGFACSLTMEQCIFDGAYTNTTANGNGVGGLIGYINGGNTVIRNCINSGSVNADLYTENNQPKAGGLVGQVASSATLSIENCLNTGLVSTVKTYTFGRILGYNDNGCSTTVTGSYATQESCASPDSNGRPTALEYELVAQSDITGSAARTAMPLLDWVNVWQTVDGGLPTLRFSEASLGGNAVDAAAGSADIALLGAVYAGTTLYQGDMHAHADDDGNLDETAALAQWKSEMAGHDLDFVASLDHRQTTHIDNAEWDKDLFLYGTEPGTYITGLSSPSYSSALGKMHYLMLFKTKGQLENVLSSVPAYNYNPAYSGTDPKPHAANGTVGYDYADFTKSGLSSLAATVKAQGGLFVFAHPYAYEYSSASEDYFIADGTALELIYTSMSGDGTNAAYRLWKDLLAAGHKVWVTSGTDIHGGLDTQSDHDDNPNRAEKALISVYAVTDTAETSKADLVMDELVRGNFSAGSVGIKMCVGNTPMGGTVDFSGKRLVVEVSGFHKYVKDTAHKYYARVITDQGIIYSQRLSGVNSAATFALDADDSYGFYRVEVVDETGGRVISYGNPIWND